MRELKDSGIKWVGLIPKNWKTIPNKAIMSKIKQITPSYKGETILSLTMDGVIVRDLDNLKGKRPVSFDGYQKIYPGNLLMCLFDIDVTPRCVGLIKNVGLTSPAYSQFKLSKGYSSAYYYYYYLMVDNTKELLPLAKNLRHSLTEEQLGPLHVPVPPLTEQQAIADYLDAKCADIDALQQELQAEIETLQAYKKSLITRAVTQGLNSHVEMKDSGVEWIGKIPKSWRIIRGKYILKYLNKPIRKDDNVITCFRDGQVTLRKNRREDGFTVALQESGYQGIDKGDLVVHGMDGFAGAIGISDSRGKASPVLNVLDSSQCKKYIMYYLRSLAYGNVFLALSTGIRIRSCDLRWNKLAELPYPIPSLKEQQAIADYLDSKCKNINDLQLDLQTEITTLQTYKKSLIYEVVTGKKEVPVHE